MSEESKPKTVTLTGYAVVRFKKVIRGCAPEDVESLQARENQECNIDESDLGDIEEITEISMDVTP